jgi:hypothetical protein
MENEQNTFDYIDVVMLDDKKKREEFEKDYVKLDASKYHIKNVIFDDNSCNTGIAHIMVEFFSSDAKITCISTDLGLYINKKDFDKLVPEEIDAVKYNKGKQI